MLWGKQSVNISSPQKKSAAVLNEGEQPSAFSVCRNALLRNCMKKKVCLVALWNHQSGDSSDCTHRCVLTGPGERYTAYMEKVVCRIYVWWVASRGVGGWWWSFVFISARGHISGYKNNTHKDRTKVSAVELRCGQCRHQIFTRKNREWKTMYRHYQFWSFMSKTVHCVSSNFIALF